MHIYTVKLLVSSPNGQRGTLTKYFDGTSSWEALQKAIDEVKAIGFPEVHNIQIDK